MRFNNYLISEAVIIPTTKGYIDRLDKIRDNEDIVSYPFFNDTKSLLNLINNNFKKNSIYFVLTDKQSLSASTSKNGNIKIYVNDNFYDVFVDDKKYYKFKEWLEKILNHELIHREQSKKVDWSKFDIKTTQSKSKKDYLSHEHEIMAYAKTTVDQLKSKLNFTGRILEFLRQPYENVSPVFDMYVNEFNKDSKVLKKFYKYIYEYIIKS